MSVRRNVLDEMSVDEVSDYLPEGTTWVNLMQGIHDLTSLQYSNVMSANL